MTPIAPSALSGLIGTEVGVSDWITVDQARIDAFADITEDRQFIHVDPERAKATPFGGTIAHGFLTLSLLSRMSFDGVAPLEGVVMGVNYGFDKVRFLAPVPSGARVEPLRNEIGNRHFVACRAKGGGATGGKRRVERGRFGMSEYDQGFHSIRTPPGRRP